MKFSIIVPVYNVEKYLKKCLDSIINQTYKDYELIIVNDGSPDSSQKIIDEYANKYCEKIKAVKKENGGLSDARNYGLQYVTGDYLVFIDSDDYVKKDMLEQLNYSINDNEDIIGYGMTTVDSDYNEIGIMGKPAFDTINGEQALIKLIESRQPFETACTYAYSLNYWKQNDYKFEVGRYHEDFGLIPEVIAKADKVKCLDYNGYYYLQNNNSITKNNSLALKKANDVLHYYDKLKNIDIKDKKSKAYLNSYIANAVLLKKDSLTGDEKNKYIKKICEKKVYNDLLDDTLTRKLKKIICKIKLKGGVIL